MQHSVLTIAKMLDHSLLKPTLTEAELWAGCRLATDHEVASVCIMPFAVKRCAELLADSSVHASTTVGFPHGGQTQRAKMFEAKEALASGATELDMVVNISKVLSGEHRAVKEEIAAVLDVVRSAGAKLKVIFENCYLNREQKLALCEIAGDLKVDWVKTSTGFGTGGATLEDLELMVKNTPSEVSVKAAGGVRSLEKLLAVAELGVNRVGTTATAAILEEAALRFPPDR